MRALETLRFRPRGLAGPATARCTVAMTESPAAPPPDPTAIRKRSMRIAGHPTSISLEQAFWEVLRDVAARHGLRPAELVAQIDRQRTGPNPDDFNEALLHLSGGRVIFADRLGIY